MRTRAGNRSPRGTERACVEGWRRSVVAIVGMRMSAKASINTDRDFGQIAREEIIEEAAEIDPRARARLDLTRKRV